MENNIIKINIDTNEVTPLIPKINALEKVTLIFESSKKILDFKNNFISILLNNRKEKIEEINNSDIGKVKALSSNSIQFLLPKTFSFNGLMSLNIKYFKANTYDIRALYFTYEFAVVNDVETNIENEVKLTEGYDIINSFISEFGKKELQIDEYTERNLIKIKSEIDVEKKGIGELISNGISFQINEVMKQKEIKIGEHVKNKLKEFDDNSKIINKNNVDEYIKEAKEEIIKPIVITGKKDITKHIESVEIEVKERIEKHAIEKNIELRKNLNEHGKQVTVKTTEEVENFIKETAIPEIQKYVKDETLVNLEKSVTKIVNNMDQTETFKTLTEKLEVYIDDNGTKKMDTIIDEKKPEMNAYFDQKSEALKKIINNNVVQGNLIFDTAEERDEYVKANVAFSDKVFIGLTVFVINDMMNYFYKGNRSWGKFHSSATVHVGTEPPEDKSMIWINPEEEDADSTIGGEILEEFRTSLKDAKDKIYEISHAINGRIDPGVFDPAITDDEGKELLYPKTVNTVLTKRGAKKFLPELVDGEMAFSKDTEELFIGNGGKIVNLTNKKGGESGGNLTGEYLDLIAPNSTRYRVTINNTGNFVIYRAELDDAPDPKTSEAARYIGLIINQIYGGGDSSSATISHDFIELYNKTPNKINLKGLSLQCASNDSPWEVLELKGEILPFSSFLVRCGANKPSNLLKYKISDFDTDWDIKISDKGTKVYLGIGRVPCPSINPFNADGAGNKQLGYIDLMGIAGKDKTRVIDAFEKTMLHILDKNTSARRHDFNDAKDNSLKNIRAIDYSKIENEIYLPRCKANGKWDIYFNKMKLCPDKPNLISVTYGQSAESSRCFTWQSIPTDEGWLYYCEKEKALSKDGAEFIGVKSNLRAIQHTDSDATVHSVILTNLKCPAKYLYRVGFKSEDGSMRWGDITEFEIKTYTADSHIKILHTTDQQAWDEHEYKCWGLTNEFLEKKHPFTNYDFRLNTGDISQNASRSFEWRYYFDYAQRTLEVIPEMTCIGNNDLIDKKYTEAWTYYYTYQNSPLPSVYSFDLGYCHFASLDAWVGLGHHFQEVPAPTLEDPNATKKVDMHLQKQMDWLEQDLAKSTKRWNIVYMHLSPFTVSVNKKQLPFAKIFEKYGVQLVICGHNHCYSRSLPIFGHTTNEKGKIVPTIDYEKGIYYVLSQASGYKLSGKDKPKPNLSWIPVDEDTKNGTEPKSPCWTPDQPSYIIWDIDYDKIVMKSYMLKGLKTNIPQDIGTNKEYNSLDKVEEHLFDTLTIHHK